MPPSLRVPPANDADDMKGRSAFPFLGLAALAAAAPVAAQVMPDPMSMMGMPADVARLSDADASCEQLYAEAIWLEQRIAALPKAADPTQVARQMQEDMRKAQRRMINGQRAKSLGATLLSLVPGVGGLAAGAASSMAGRPNADAVYEAMDKSMQAQQESLAATMRTAGLQARREHVTRLFLERRCKVATLDQATVARASASLAANDGADAGAPTPAPSAESVPTPPGPANAGTPP